MEFTLKTFIFYGFAFLTIASALVVVTVRKHRPRGVFAHGDALWRRRALCLFAG